MGQTIGLKASDGFLLGGYRADPAKPKAGLVVIQEIFGVNHHIRNVCDRFAALGYAVVAPAMFDRAKADVDLGYDDAAVDEGVKLRAAIKLEDSLKDVQAAIDALQPAGKVGVVGYYGGRIAAHKDEMPKVPTILHFGELDEGIPMSDVEKIKAARPDVKIYTYPADHGFSCDERAKYEPASHEKALKVTLAFFQKNLEN